MSGAEMTSAPLSHASAERDVGCAEHAAQLTAQTRAIEVEEPVDRVGSNYVEQ